MGVIGYKRVNLDMTCRGFNYEVWCGKSSYITVNLEKVEGRGLYQKVIKTDFEFIKFLRTVVKE